MERTSVLRVIGAVLLLLTGYFVGRGSNGGTVAAQQDSARVFELRTYTTPDGKLDLLNARFRDHTRRIFDRHHMTSIGYWTPVDTPNTLVYILAHPSADEAKKNWDAFRADPEWQKVKGQTEAQGLTGIKVESRFMQATDYSAIK
jgi:NIPSNAP protein